MAAKKRTKATEAPATTSQATATSTATATLPLSPLPLQHYLARVPLQLAAIIFCLYTSADKKSFPLSTPTQRTISSLVQDPTAFLLTACTSILVVQAWFGNWARGCRKAAEQAEKEGPKAATSKQQQQQGKKGFSGAFKEMWSDAKQGKAPHKKLFQQEGKQAPSLDFLNLKVS